MKVKDRSFATWLHAQKVMNIASTVCANTFRRVTITSLLITCVAGCDRQEQTSPVPTIKTEELKTPETPIAIPDFEELSTTSGTKHVYDNGEAAGIRSIVESLGGGLGVVDFDSDGFDDLFFPGGGKFVVRQPLSGLPNSLWRNLNGLAFHPVATSALVSEANHYTHGCAISDYDADGFPDILVTGYGGLQLFRNQGDGTYQDNTIPSGMTDNQWSTSAAWADFNNDGNLDVYITNYVDWSWDKHPQCTTPVPGQREICSPQDFNALLDIVFTSNGDGTFRAGQNDVGISVAGKGLGVVAFDANGDMATDVYVANDTTNNLLFLNDGQGMFREQGVLSGTAFDQNGVPNGSMGLAILDYNNDLRPDIWVTNYENETFALYQNDDFASFRCVTESTGVTAIGNLYVGFGTVAADFRRTGFEDIVVSNGHVMMYPIASTISQEALYLANDGRGRLRQLPPTNDSYFSNRHRGRGVVYTDFNRDGKIDLAFSHTNEPASVLTLTSDLAGHWYCFRLVGTTANRDAIGAKLVLKTGDRSMSRTIIGGGSYLSQNTYEVWFGVPDSLEKSGTLSVEWPTSKKTTQISVTANEINLVIEGR